MDVLIKNGTVVTCDREDTIIRYGAVAVTGNKIAAVGGTSDMERRYPNLDVIDARNKAVLPGFINAHTHTVLTVIRGTVEDMESEVIYTYMSPITIAMTPDERSAMTALGCLEAIRSGATTLVDPLRWVTTYAQTMVDTGLRLFLSESCADALTLKIRFGEYEYSREWGEQFLERAEALVERFHDTENGRVQVQTAAHAPDNCSPWMLEKLLDMARKHGLRRTVHLAQSQLEVDQVKKISGRTSVEYLQDNGWLDSDVLAAHWTYCTEKDIEILAETGVHMATCPSSSSTHGNFGLANYPAIFDAGVNVALGTDNMTEDMFHAMNKGLITQRGMRGGGINPPPEVMLRCATTNGATALGRDHDLGSIEAGKLADLCIVNANRPHLVPAINIVSNLVHYGQAGDVETVMVDGEMVMQDGVVLTMNEEDVVRNAQEATVSSWRRLHEQYPDVPMPPSLVAG